MLNSKFLAISLKSKDAVLWVDKGIWLLPPILQFAVKFTSNTYVQHNTDFLNRSGFKFWLLYAFLRMNTKYFHVSFTCNEDDLAFFSERGCKMVRTSLGFDHLRFHPRRDLFATSESRPKNSQDIVFLGHFEERTSRYLCHALDNGFPVKIYGSGWMNSEIHKKYPDMLTARRLSDNEYEEIIANALAAISIPSEVNKNEYSGRTFEIPAMATLLIALDTPAHRSFFSDDEAMFFKTENDLLKTLNKVLKYPYKSRQMGEMGYLRCCLSGYSWRDLTIKELEVVLNEKK